MPNIKGNTSCSLIKDVPCFLERSMFCLTEVETPGFPSQAGKGDNWSSCTKSFASGTDMVHISSTKLETSTGCAT